MEQSNLITVEIIPWTRGVTNHIINIEENSTINDLTQIIKKIILEREGLRWGDGRDGWHLFYGGRNLYDPLSLLNEYNIQEGTRINILPGNRSRDLVPRGKLYEERDMIRARQLSIRSESRRKRLASLQFRRIERRVCDAPDEPPI